MRSKRIVLKKVRPYTDETRRECSFKEKNFIGVYFIYELQPDCGLYTVHNLVYIGFSSGDLKKTLYRHFQKWNDKRHPENKRMSRIERVTYYKGFINDNYRISIYSFRTGEEAHKFERENIQYFRPRDNANKYELDLFIKNNPVDSFEIEQDKVKEEIKRQNLEYDEDGNFNLF